jgi:hypothetical protein
MNKDDIDNLIATRIMGWVVHPRNTIHWMRSGDSQIGYKIMGSTCCSDKFCPSRKLSDAWRVVEHITQPCVGKVDGMPWSTKCESCQFEGTWWDMVCFARNVLASENTKLAAPSYYMPELENDNYTGPAPYVMSEESNASDHRACAQEKSK